CYIAGDCQPMQLQASDCAAGAATEVATIKAPKGLQSYRWQAKNELGNWVDLQDIQDIRIVNDSILRIQTVDFPVDQTTGGRVSTNDFKCIMTSAMDPSKPFTSWLQTTVNNKKPYMSITTSSECDGSVTFTDISVAPYVETFLDKVDTSQSKWDFGDGSPIKVGGCVSHTYAEPGEYNVTLITTAANGTCYTEGSRPATVRKRPPLDVVTSDTNICQGDRLRFLSGTDVQLYDYRWVVHRQDGHKDTILDDPELLWYFQDTSIVELTARNAAGCDTTVFKTIYVEEFPKLIIEGDTVVCNGTQSIINVSSNLPNCTFGWYLDMENTTPNYTGSQMVRTPTQDETYYVKVTTPNGCVSWDSLHIRLMIPELTSDKVKICAYDTVQLIGKNAVTYEWTATPSDPSLVGQENKDTIYVTPLVNTTYKMVGLGNNGCRANPLTKNITVYPYPIPQLEYDPTFVDSENPFITFNNLTVGATYTEWDFHDGKKMSGPTVTYEFKDFTIDSAYVTMTTSNEMGCTSDTTIAMPISIFAVWVPNAFTPDKSDNNLFRTYTGNDIRDYSLYIYDREGRQLFYTDDKEGTWDGTFNGKKCQQGVYVWVVSYRRLETDKVLQQKGTVVLLR
ncbi:MAG: gliding motility-associated C-terminal domain-containing protein, partial [Bacteroidales bacterium]|nr:gliding motility-associated C-terminal domain-containing protein [Bacteroidales bacterium]